MSTSNPPAMPPAGGARPDPDAPQDASRDAGPDPLLADRLEGAVPTEDPDTPDAGPPGGAEGSTGGGTGPDAAGDSVAADRRRTGAD